MIDNIRNRFTSAHLMAAISLFVALSMGGAWAAGVAKNSVRSKQIKDGAVVGKDVRDASLTGADLREDSVDGADVRDDGLTGADVDEGTLSLPQADPTPRGPAGGALTGEFPNPLLATDSVGADALAPGGVTTAELQSDAVTSDDVEPGAIDGSKVADASLRADDLATASVGSPEIAGGAVGASEVDTDAVDSDEIDDGTLNGDDIGHDSGVTTFDLASLGPGNCTTRQIDVGVASDLRDDLISVSLGAAWPAQLTVTPVAPQVAGDIALHFCNTNQAFSSDPLPTQLRWIAFRV